MQRIIEELNNARGHVLIARAKLWKKRNELPNLSPYNQAHEAIDILEGAIWTLEHWEENQTDD